MSNRTAPARARNDLAQYDDLAESWWDPRGSLAMLHWIAAARASRIPAAERPDALLVDLGCGAGLLAPHLQGKGYRVVGFDLTESALREAVRHAMTGVRSDVTAVPLADGCADVVSAGEILEHVTDLDGTLDEACRLLRPGGVLVLDTIARTLRARLIAVELAERIPGGAPKGIHDPRLFVDRKALLQRCASHGIQLKLIGMHPATLQMLAYLCHRRADVEMRYGRSTAILFQGFGVKAL